MNFDPNDLFYQMIGIYSSNKTEDNKITICNEGSSRCFSRNTIIVTDNGYKHICDINVGDVVKTYNESKNKIEFKPVCDVLDMINSKPCYRITLKNGDIIEATDDHEFYFNGKWVKLKDIINLWHESTDIDKRD